MDDIIKYLDGGLNLLNCGMLEDFDPIIISANKIGRVKDGYFTCENVKEKDIRKFLKLVKVDKVYFGNQSSTQLINRFHIYYRSKISDEIWKIEGIWQTFYEDNILICYTSIKDLSKYTKEKYPILQSDKIRIIYKINVDEGHLD